MNAKKSWVEPQVEEMSLSNTQNDAWEGTQPDGGHVYNDKGEYMWPAIS